MKSLWNSFVVAFSMYSKIPMPRADWEKENMKYSLCFFPWIGLVIGLLELGWFYLAGWLAFGTVFRSAVMVLIPVAVTGGIHLDGLLDTADALSSWREKERRLEILKDSHAGAFAVITGLVYFLLAFGTASQVNGECLPVLCLSFALARTYSALSVENFPKANPSGTAAAFRDNSRRNRVNTVMAVYLILICTGAVLLDPLYGFLAAVASAAVFWYYHHMAMKYFGGMTGDLAGFFVSVCELVTALTVVIGNRIAEMMI
jgi:adenosylcobinamide-GDP ribazoletransferase